MSESRNKTSSIRFFLRLYRFWNELRDRFAASLQVSDERKKDLYIELSRAATLRDLVYWLQILFSAGIATLGLILNSPAVIIGAMLISPLMNPILACGLALATGDLVLGLRSVLNLFLSSAISIGFAFLLVAFLPFKEQTPEIMARTSPNTLDLGIALFSGAIGSIAVCREVKGAVTSIPGVAIAVALMPPLCVIGYGIGLATSFNFYEGLRIAGGGGLLYLTNLVAITFTAMVVLVLLRIDTRIVRKAVMDWRENDGESRWLCKILDKIPTLEKAREIRSFSVRLTMILLPLVLIFIPLSQSFSKLRVELIRKQEQNRIEQKARDLWREFYAEGQNGEPRSFIDDLRINEKDEKLTVYLRVFDNVPYSAREKKEYVKLLASNLNRPVDSISFQLVEVPTSARNSPDLQAASTPLPVLISEIHLNYLKLLEDALDGIQFPAPAQKLNYRIISSPDSEPSLQIYYLSDREISPDALELMSGDIQSRLNLSNLLISFERIPTEPYKFSIKSPTREINEDDKNLLQQFGGYLKRHPRLMIVFTLKKADEENQSLTTGRQDFIKKYFLENWGISEDRLIFSENENEAEADTFRIILPE
jgi:uncharacterized hydrophobic protein (TIGR00271 family)